nr:cdp-diacylglycerol--inositol 3-phosphatidyltransferase [Quercus suber]POF24046.1 cdp-diacylglycerol--inositol 3-phosphatidyltransferase [Quercus suber]
MFAGISSNCETGLQHDLSGTDLTRSGITLHAHVRYPRNGWIRGEPQERQRRQELDHEQVLQQQGKMTLSATYGESACVIDIFRQLILFTCCALNELFFIALYLLCFSSPTITPALLPIVSPAGLNGTSATSPNIPAPSLLFPSPFSAAAMEMARANKMNSLVPWILTLASCPVMLLKQWINGVQLVKAAKWLAEGDRKARKKAQRAALAKRQ